MARLAAQREHLEGLYAVVEMEFETAKEAADEARLRELLAVANEQLRWGREDPPPPTITLTLSDSLRARLMSLALRVGNERLADAHHDRAQGARVDRRRERVARSMVAFHEHNQSASG